jgi:hypothetical protein
MKIRLGAMCSISQKLELSDVFTLTRDNLVMDCSYHEGKRVRDAE